MDMKTSGLYFASLLAQCIFVACQETINTNVTVLLNSEHVFEVNPTQPVTYFQWYSQEFELTRTIAFFQISGSQCIMRDFDNIENRFNTSCESATGPFIFIVKSTEVRYQDTIIRCLVQYSGTVPTTIDWTIRIYLPLTNVSLNPNGTVQLSHSSSKEFVCSASSIPPADFAWNINGSRVNASMPPYHSPPVKRSSYLYRADKNDNGKILQCVVTRNSSTLLRNVVLDILYRPEVSVQPALNPYKVIENTTNMQLTCNVIDSNPHVTAFRWFKDNMLQTFVGGLYEIPYVSKLHGGIYTCEGINTVGTSNKSSEVKIEVLYGVSVNLIDDKQPREGSMFSIPCTGQSYPPVTDSDVTWTKQNNNSFVQNKQTLVIDKVNRLDSGVYTCTITKTLVPSKGSSVQVTGSTTVVVNVLYQPIVQVLPDESTIAVIANSSSFVMSCNVVDSNPEPTSFLWNKDGQNISSTKKQNYTIAAVRPGYSGIYTCYGTNEVGTSDRSKGLELLVLYGVSVDPIDDKQPHEGSMFSIDCTGQSYPPVTDSDVTWTKQNNNSFIQNKQTLVIDKVNRLDSGVYTCTITKTLVPSKGSSVQVTGSTTVVVNVLYRPTVQALPAAEKYNVIENTTMVVLACRVVVSNPLPLSFNWYKGAIDTPIANNQNYTFAVVKRMNEGFYSCDGTNSIGTSEKSEELFLNILYGVIVNPIDKQQPHEGNQSIITCSGQSNPPLSNNSFKWTKQNNDTFALKGQTLEIDHVNRIDSGEYMCTVMMTLKPSVGESVQVTGSTTVSVDVLYVPTVQILPEGKPYTIKENTTQFGIHCHVSSANPYPSMFKWYKDKTPMNDRSQNLTIEMIRRNDAGEYTCAGENDIGVSAKAESFILDVLYGVSLKMTHSSVNVIEGSEWNLTCYGVGNPTPSFIWTFQHNDSVVESKTIYNQSVIERISANCMDTGTYFVMASNGIGSNVTSYTTVRVQCTPREEVNRQNINIYLNESISQLDITSFFISFPEPNITWKRSNDTVQEQHGLNTSNSLTELPYKVKSRLFIQNVKNSDFGYYYVTAANAFGQYTVTYNVQAKRKPDKPFNLSANCHSDYIDVGWISPFNGGENITFDIVVNIEGFNQTILSGISDVGEKRQIKSRLQVEEETLYNIFIVAVNVFGRTVSDRYASCMTGAESHSALIGGLAGGTSGLIVIAIAFLGLVIKRRTRKADDRKAINSHQTEEDDNEELKDNPMYVSSGSEYLTNDTTKTAFTAISSLVMKHGKNEEQNKDDTSKKRQRKMNKTGKGNKGIELGCVYENAADFVKQEEQIYANENNEKGIIAEYRPHMNKDGLIYAELDFAPLSAESRFVIRGSENKNNYAIIDLSKKAAPLPSDEEENDECIKKNE